MSGCMGRGWGGEEQEDEEKEQLICYLSSRVAKTLIFTPLVSLPNSQCQTSYCLSQKNNKRLINSFRSTVAKRV